MQFTVFAFSPIPDVQTARQNFRLENLSDKDVAKVLYHQRKQKTGHSEALNWDQKRIASVSLVHYSLDYVEMSSFGMHELDEPDLIGKVYQALARTGLLVTWGGDKQAMPLLHFRCMQHRISQPAYWQARNAGQEIHIDLQGQFGADPLYDPNMNELASRFGYPGMLGMDEDKVWDAHLANDTDSVLQHSDHLALNTYLLSLELFSLNGRMSYADADRARMKLRDYLEKQGSPKGRFDQFLSAWHKEAV